MKMVKKITASKMMGGADGIRKAIEAAGPNGKDGTKVHLFDVYGMSNGFELGESDMGPYTRFRGEFEAVNALTGEEVNSSALFLPNEITPLLKRAVDQGKGSSVQFALKIGANKRLDVPIGYEYTVEPIVAPAPAPEMQSLRERLKLPVFKQATAQPALPQSTPAKVATPAPAKKK